MLRAEEIHNMESSTQEEEKSILTTKYRVSVEKAVIRSGKGSQYSVLMTVYKNDVIEVQSIKDGWAKVKVREKVGYIASKNIKKM